MKKSIMREASAKTRAKMTFLSIIGLCIGAIFLFPVYWMLIGSFKDDMELITSITLWPQNFTFRPWVEQLTSSDFFFSLRNSILIALTSMCISVSLGVPAAYGMSRFQMKGKAVLLLLFLVSQMMPSSLLLTPLFLTFSKIGLLNTYLAPALSVASGSIPFIVVTLRPFFLRLPKSLDDAAKIDGCNAFTSFVRIMIPVIQSGLITVLVFTFLHGWNDLAYSMTFNINEGMRPLTANIHKFMTKYGYRWNYLMAYGMILALPVVLMFVFMQRYIVGGLTSGAVKE